MYHRLLPRHSWCGEAWPGHVRVARLMGAEVATVALFLLFIFFLSTGDTLLPAACCLALHKNIINLYDPLLGQLPGENKPGKYTFILMCTEIKHVTCRVGGKYSYKSSSRCLSECLYKWSAKCSSNINVTCLIIQRLLHYLSYSTLNKFYIFITRLYSSRVR